MTKYKVVAYLRLSKDEFSNKKEFAYKITNKQYIIKNGGHINSETG